MQNINKLKSYWLVFCTLILLGLPFLFLTAPNFASAATSAQSGGGTGGAPPVPYDCTKKSPTEQSLNACLKKNPIVKDLNVVVNFLSIGVGVVVIAMIILGGIQYIAAGNNAQSVAAAKQRIINALIALFAFLFIFSFLQWLIPGGLF